MTAEGRAFIVLALALALGLGVVACTGPGAAIAEKIRAAKSPIVTDVVLVPANPFEGSGEEVYVLLASDATEAQELDLWCNVVVPAGADGLPPNAVQLRQGDELLPGGNHSFGTRVLVNPVCPEAG